MRQAVNRRKKLIIFEYHVVATRKAGKQCPVRDCRPRGTACAIAIARNDIDYVRYNLCMNLDPTADLEENLWALAKRHKELSGRRVNWLGTYQHAKRVWQKGLEYKRG